MAQVTGGLAQVNGGLAEAEAGLAQLSGAISQMEAADPNNAQLAELKAQQAAALSQQQGLLAEQAELNASKAGAGRAAIDVDRPIDQPRDIAPAALPRNRSVFLEYPEDIQLYGISFNTELGATGISVQGEVSYRKRYAASD